MPGNKNCKLPQPSRSSGQKKKKRKKATAATTAPQNTDKHLVLSLPSETSPVSLLPPQNLSQPQVRLLKLRPTSKKSGTRLAGSGSGAPVQRCVTELSVQARESLRWEGVLQDPQAEAKRLEQYRANRRQRYITHRESLLKETQDALRQTFSKESKEKKASAESDQQ